MDNDTSRDPGRPGPRAAAPARELPPGTAPAPAAGPPPPRDVEAAVIAALAADDPARARDLVAAAAIPGRPGSAPVAAARARIALHLGDHEAARAILVAAIEAHPEAAACAA